MTAVGFALFWIGTISALCFREPNNGIQTKGHDVSIVLALVGVVCILIGVTAWMWEALP